MIIPNKNGHIALFITAVNRTLLSFYVSAHKSGISVV